jgi:hypothetical protein
MYILLKEVRVVAVRRIHFASISLGHAGCGLLCQAPSGGRA